MHYVNKVDKVIILISNISTKASSQRVLSQSNIKDLLKFNENFKKWLDTPQGKAFASEKLTINVSNALNDLVSKATANELTFEYLQNSFKEVFKGGTIRSLEFSKNVYGPFEKCIKNLEKKLFSSIRKTANGGEITPEMSKEIFDIFAKAYRS